jgi:hypothetical protein
VKPSAVFQTDQGVDVHVGSDSEQSDSDEDSENDEPHGKYAFLQNHPLYETHQVIITESKNMITSP